jgi:hypothetical protein
MGVSSDQRDVGIGERDTRQAFAFPYIFPTTAMASSLSVKKSRWVSGSCG